MWQVTCSKWNKLCYYNPESYAVMSWDYLLSSRDKDRSNTPPTVILTTLCPPLSGEIFGGVGTECGRTLTYPIHLITLGTRETCLFGRTRKRFCKKNTRSEIRTRVVPTTPNVMQFPTEL